MVSENTSDAQGELWVFGYGSLIWRPGFSHLSSQRAELPGFERRFCQASHDHRGTPAQPGRVVTLVPVLEGVCTGTAFELAQHGRGEVLAYLDEREQDGYERIYSDLILQDGRRVPGLTWIAREGNPSWRAGESMDEVARLIAQRRGPSGSNSDYLYQLEKALVSMQIPDNHVMQLSERVRAFSVSP